MKKFLFSKYSIILSTILIIALFLRAYHINTWPRLGATFDEYAWTWLGMSLIQGHAPSSWSYHPQYQGHRKFVIYQHTNFWIVKPYLEHPPLFGLVAGSFALLNHTKGMFDLSIDKIRPLALILGIVSVLAVFLLVREVYSIDLAIISSLI